jgi:senataxin
VNYGRSLFERLERLGHPVHLLNIQYRMHPSISLFPNREFYENNIKNGPNVEMEQYGYTYLTSEMYGAYAFINVADGREEEDDFGMSKRNIIEAAVVMYILSKLYKG